MNRPFTYPERMMIVERGNLTPLNAPPALPDPRFITRYAADWNPSSADILSTDVDGNRPWFHQQNKFYVPLDSFINEGCGPGGNYVPGYQRKRPDDGFTLTVNDYPFHPVELSNGLWPLVTPQKLKNRV